MGCGASAKAGQAAQDAKKKKGSKGEHEGDDEP